jgi:hypothetical protein
MENKKICYDILSVPEGISLNELLRIAETTNYLFWNSFNNAQSPKCINLGEGNNDMPKIVIDINTEEGKVIYDKVIKELYGSKDN